MLFVLNTETQRHRELFFFGYRRRREIGDLLRREIQQNLTKSYKILFYYLFDFKTQRLRDTEVISLLFLGMPFGQNQRSLKA